MKLKAQVKLETGKGINRRLRHSGSVPAVLYGKHQPPVPVILDQHEVEKVISAGGARKLLTLEVAGLQDEKNEAMVMFKDIQRNAITGKLVHIDLYSIRRGETLHMTIPLVFVGEPEDTDKGGTVQYSSREINIECLPKNIPSVIEVDISHLEIGHSLTLADLALPEGVKLLDDPGRVVASIVAVRAEKVQEEEESEEADTDQQSSAETSKA